MNSGRKPSFCNLIQFVLQNSDVKNEEEKLDGTKQSSQFSQDGIDIKSFYETVVNNGSTLNENVDSCESLHQPLEREIKDQLSSVITETTFLLKTVHHDDFNVKTGSGEGEKTVSMKTSSEFNKSSSQVSFHIQSQNLKLLRSAQAGELEHLSQHLKNGADINYKDFYGWTPLMCSAKEGHQKVVKYLLKYGSDYTICNSEGQTAYMLAKMSGHKHVVKAMSDFFNKSQESNIASDVKQEQNTSSSYFCQICKSKFSVSEKASHKTSTVHLFNSGHKRKGPSYLIPETNKGFQMLLKTGWEVDKGLGPNGEGSKYPVKTVLKYDRKGLGSDNLVKKAKITHFNPNDQSAVMNHKLPHRKMSVKKVSQNAIKAMERKERQRERYLRCEFSS